MTDGVTMDDVTMVARLTCRAAGHRHRLLSNALVTHRSLVKLCFCQQWLLLCFESDGGGVVLGRGVGL